MSGKRVKKLRKAAIKSGIDIYTLQIKGRGITNKFRHIKKNYTRFNIL